MPDDDDHTLRISPQRNRPGPPRGDGSPRIDALRTEVLPLLERPVSVTTAVPDDQAYALQKPAWPRALKMQPHHYESQDAYHERRTSFVLGLLLDQPWGIFSLELSGDALQ